MYVYTLTKREMEDQYTHAAHFMIIHLSSEGIITKEQANKLIATKQIIIRKKNTLTKILNKMFPKDEKAEMMMIATIEDMRLEEIK